MPVLACADGTVRVLDAADLEAHCRQSKGQPLPRHELRIPSTPTALHLAANDGGESGQNVLFGTDDGRVGVITVTRFIYKKNIPSRHIFFVSLFLLNLFPHEI